MVQEKMVVTASEICVELDGRISNGAVRTMLTRLMRKGVLRRYRSGYGKTFLYVPAAAHGDLSELAFRRLAEDFFDGSIPEAANAITKLLSSYSQRSESL